MTSKTRERHNECMNKLIFFFCLISLTAYAQNSKVPDADVSSETVDIPDIVDTFPEESVTKEVTTAPVNDEMKDVEDAVVDANEIEETSTPDVSIPATPEKIEPEVTETTLSDSTTPAITAEVDDNDDFKPYKSHWNAAINFETVKYPTPFIYSNKSTVTTKKAKSFDEPDSELYGGRVGFGRDWYIGKGLNTRSMVEVYYLGSAFTKERTANPDANAKISTTKTTGSMYGVDISQSIGLMFDLKTKNPFMDEMTYLVIEPFVEAGIGAGRAVNRVNFEYDKSTGVDSYRHRISDNLASARIGAGLMMTAQTGFYFMMRATINRYEVLNRDQSVNAKIDGNAVAKDNLPTYSDKIDNAMVMYTVGGGYKF